MATQPESNISSDFPFDLQNVGILDSNIAYIDTSDAGNTSTTAAIFLHGNPTSSYLWRNIIPHVSPNLRCIAPDLIGMGKSGKPSIAYRFVDHVRYLDTFLDTIVPQGNVVLVIQDWGSALGFHWANRHRDRVIGLAFMEFIRPFPTWDDVGPEAGQNIFKAFRTPNIGRKLLVEDNLFLKVILPGGVARVLSAEEQAYYNAPFSDEKSREPVYRWPNEIPISGFPEDVYKIAEEYHTWLLENDVPKLMFWAVPGAFVGEEKAKWYVENLKNLRAIFLGAGTHYLQEDHPNRIGSEIAKFISKLDLSK